MKTAFLPLADHVSLVRARLPVPVGQEDAVVTGQPRLQLVLHPLAVLLASQFITWYTVQCVLHS